MDGRFWESPQVILAGSGPEQWLLAGDALRSRHVIIPVLGYRVKRQISQIIIVDKYFRRGIVNSKCQLQIGVKSPFFNEVAGFHRHARLDCPLRLGPFSLPRSARSRVLNRGARYPDRPVQEQAGKNKASLLGLIAVSWSWMTQRPLRCGRAAIGLIKVDAVSCCSQNENPEVVQPWRRECRPSRCLLGTYWSPSGKVWTSLFTAADRTHRRSWRSYSPQPSHHLRVCRGSSTNTRSQPNSIRRGQPSLWRSLVTKGGRSSYSRTPGVSHWIWSLSGNKDIRSM